MVVGQLAWGKQRLACRVMEEPSYLPKNTNPFKEKPFSDILLLFYSVTVQRRWPWCEEVIAVPDVPECPFSPAARDDYYALYPVAAQYARCTTAYGLLSGVVIS
jgi:hypothetical protein